MALGFLQSLGSKADEVGSNSIANEGDGRLGLKLGGQALGAENTNSFRFVEVQIDPISAEVSSSALTALPTTS